MAPKKRAAPPAAAGAKTAKAPRRESVGIAAALRGLHSEEAGGQRFVELTSLAKMVQKKQMGDKALQSTWRRAGFDVLIPEIDGVRGLSFPTQKGHARDKLMPAANPQGLQAYVRELDQEVIDASAAVLEAVAAELGGDAGGAQLDLQSRHKVMDLAQRARVHVAVTGGRPCMVLTALLESLGVSNPRRCVNASLLPYFRACRVPGDLSSDEPDLSSRVQARTQLDKYLEDGVQDYELALASRSQGLLRGRSAWHDGRETWLIDFPLVVLVVNRARAEPQSHGRRRRGGAQSGGLLAAGAHESTR